MSEAAFYLFHRGLALMMVLLYAGSMAAFFWPFLPAAGRWRRWQRAAAAAVCYGLAYLLCIATDLPHLACVLLVPAVLAALSRPLELDRTGVFLLTAVFFSARTAGALIVESLEFLISRALLYGQVRPEVIYLRSALTLTLVFLAHMVIFSVMLYALARLLLRRPLELERGTLGGLLLTPVTGILFGKIISSLLVVIKDGVFFQLYEQYPVFLALIPLTALALYAGTWLAIAAHQKMAALQEEQRLHLVEQRQLQTIRERMEEAEAFYDSVRQMRHDLRGHLASLQGLARCGNWAELEGYMARMDGDLGRFELAVPTGNPVTDVIINDMRARALKLGADFQMAFRCPEGSGYDAYDLGVILHNLLENALEACEQVEPGDRYIALTGGQRGRFLLLEVRNAFSGTITLDPRTRLPVTTKADPAALHGIGLGSVRRAVERYMGEMEIKTRGREFEITILLQERNGI